MQAGAQPGPNQPAGTNPLPADAAARAGTSAGSPTPLPTAQQAVGAAGTMEAGYTFPAAQLTTHTRAYTPIPDGLTIDTNLKGDPARGQAAFLSCIGCHAIRGNPIAAGVIGPNLTHVGSRNTIAAGLFPNDTRHLALWIKNARAMKPGVTMPTLGLGQYDPVTKAQASKATGGLTDQQIMDIVAYLQALK